MSWRKTDEPNGGGVAVDWREQDGPEVKAPSRNGFGSTLIEQGLPSQLQGKASLRFERDGVACTIEFPLSS